MNGQSSFLDRYGQVAQPDLSHLSPQEWLLERLKQHGIDVYAGGPFESLQDRLAHAIVSNRFGTVIAGRHNGKPESYAEVFERIYATKLKNVVPPAKRDRQGAAL